MSTKSTAAKVLMYIVIAIIIILVLAWIVGGIASWLYSVTFGWWLDPILATVNEGANLLYDSVYKVLDDFGTVAGGLGGTVETNLGTGIINTVGNAAVDTINWFLSLFTRAGQVLGG